MRATVKTILVLAAAQALMLGAWYAVEQGRSKPREAGTLPTAYGNQVEHLDRPAADIGFDRGDGTRGQLSDFRGGPVVLHFWATWCPPCRQELPSLLAFASETGTPVLAMSLDREWQAIRRYLGGQPPLPLVLGCAEEAKRAFDVDSLPVTYVVDPSGRLRLRLEGPRNWASDTLRATLNDVTRPSSP